MVIKFVQLRLVKIQFQKTLKTKIIYTKGLSQISRGTETQDSTKLHIMWFKYQFLDSYSSYLLTLILAKVDF